MVDALPQLCQNVQQAHLVGGISRPVHHIKVHHRDLGVKFSLHLAEVDNDLGFCRVLFL